MLIAECVELPPPIYGRAITLYNQHYGLVARIQTGVSMCCGMNVLYNFQLSNLDSVERAKALFDDMAAEPWKSPKSGPAPHFTMKHFIFTCGMGKKGPYNREEPYKYLIADPRVKLISRVPSASEPEEGHDIGIFLLDLS